MENYKKRQLLRRVKMAITTLFVVGTLLRVGLGLRQAMGQALPDMAPATEAAADDPTKLPTVD